MVEVLTTETLLQAKSYADDAPKVDLRSGIDGSLAVMDWKDAMVARGYGWNVSVGSLTTPIVGGGNGTVIDDDQPELVIDVPTGKTLVPLRFEIVLLEQLIAADNDEADIVIIVDQGAVSAASATHGTVESAWNMRTSEAGAAGAAGVGIVSAVTTNLTAAPTADIELAHAQFKGDVQGTAANALWSDHRMLYEPQTPPFIVGQSTIAVYWAGTAAVSGFLTGSFLVIPTAKISRLG